MLHLGISYLGGTGQPVTGLAHADVQAEFADVQIPHRVLRGIALNLLGNRLKNNQGNSSLLVLPS